MIKKKKNQTTEGPENDRQQKHGRKTSNVKYERSAFGKPRTKFKKVKS